MTAPRLLTAPLPITADELEARLADSAPAVLDVRPLAGFNGWRLGSESRGGHVPGAAAFPAAWVARVEPAEVERILRSKGVVPTREVVLYGEPGDVEAVANVLVGLGHSGLRVLEGGLAAWSAQAARPVERLPRYQQLVHTDWLAELLAGRRPEAAPTGAFRVFHVNFGVPEEYADGHIPGAGYIDTNWLEDPADWNRRDPEALHAALRRLGIRRDTTVILYGRDTVGDANEKWPGRRAGQIAATRAASILRYAGVDDVRLLDGGYDWWVNGGHEVTAEPVEPEAVESFGAPIPQRPELIIDIDDAKRILADRDGAALVSVRTWKEHIGRVSGYNYIVPAGRIAGDVWGNCGSDAYHMQHYRIVDNTMRAYPEIAANWEDAGITAD